MTRLTLTLLVIRSSDIEVLKNFYENFGMEFRREQHGNGPVHYSTILDGMVLEIYPITAPGQMADKNRLGFKVEHLDAVVAELKKQHIPILSLPKQTPFGLRATIKDPEGRTVELYKA